MKITSLKCPNCGGKIKVVSKDRGICESCTSEFYLEEEKIIKQTITNNNYYGQTPQKTNSKIPVFFILILLVGVFSFFAIKIVQPFTPMVKEQFREQPVSEPMTAFVSQVFQKPADKVSTKELQQIKYLEIKYAHDKNKAPYFMEDGWVFNYSMKPYDETDTTYSESIQHVLVEKDYGKDIDWQDFQCFSGLNYLNLNQNSNIISKNDNHSLKNLTQLKHYYGFFNNSLSSLKETFANKKQLQTLSIQLRTNEDVQQLKEYPNLNQLHVTYIGEEVTDQKNIGDLKKLESLYIETSTSSIKWLSGITTIKNLTLDSHNLNDYTVLYGQPNLEKLTIVGGKNLKNIDFLKSMPKLKEFNLDGSSILSLESLKDVKMLSALSLSDNSQITDFTPVNELTNLQKLAIEFPYDVDKEKLPNLNNLTFLTELKVNNMKNYLFLNNLAPNITHLTLKISNETQLGELTNQLANIETLVIDANDNTLYQLNQLSEFPKLKKLVINNGRIYFTGNTVQTIYSYTGVETKSLPRENEQVFQLPNVEELVFNDTTMYDIDLSLIQNSLALKKLVIYHSDNWSFEEAGNTTQSLEKSTALLTHFPNLEQLFIPNAKLTTVDFVQHLPKLKIIDISDNYVTDVAPLSKLTQLEILYKRNNPIGNLELLAPTIKVY